MRVRTILIPLARVIWVEIDSAPASISASRAQGNRRFRSLDSTP